MSRVTRQASAKIVEKGPDPKKGVIQGGKQGPHGSKPFAPGEKDYLDKGPSKR